MDLPAGNEEKAMIIVSHGLVEKIDRCRDQMGRAEFVEFCVDTLLRRGEDTGHLSGRDLGHRQAGGTVSREEFEEFKKGIKDLQRAYIDLLLAVTLEPMSKASAEEKERFKQRVAEILEG